MAASIRMNHNGHFESSAPHGYPQPNSSPQLQAIASPVESAKYSISARANVIDIRSRGMVGLVISGER